MKTIRVEQDPASSDVLERLWKNRDFELQHLWQRSVFLTAFLTLCLIGYGRLILSVFENHYSPPKLLAANVAAVGICALGVVFSSLWIVMARGSKAWYEWYEYTIRHYCRTSLATNPESEKYLSPDNFKQLHASCFQQVASPNVSARLFHLCGGPFSPSKINITIGFVVGAVFLVLFVGHLVLTIGLCFVPCFCLHLFKEWKMFLVGLLVVAVLVCACVALTKGIWSALCKLVGSSALCELDLRKNTSESPMGI